MQQVKNNAQSNTFPNTSATMVIARHIVNRNITLMEIAIFSLNANIW